MPHRHRLTWRLYSVTAACAAWYNGRRIFDNGPPLRNRQGQAVNTWTECSEYPVRATTGYALRLRGVGRCQGWLDSRSSPSDAVARHQNTMLHTRPRALADDEAHL